MRWPKWKPPPEGAIVYADLPRDPSGRKLWACSKCGASGPWKKGWARFGSFADDDDGYCREVLCPKCWKERKKAADVVLLD